MIKIGIIGAENPQAGELLRLLVRHPEVEIETLYAPALAGRQISSCHHGFIGERTLLFSDRLDLSKLDAVFIADDSSVGRNVIEKASETEGLRVIDMSPQRFEVWPDAGMEYGLSEINRKPLVRGARMAIVPTPAASVALIALYPLAAHLLLPDRISLTVHMPEDLAEKTDVKALEEEISRRLRMAQNSFGGKLDIVVAGDCEGRSLRAEIQMACPLAAPEIDRIYNSVYDDHSFAFTTLSRVGREEVEGTQKCIVSFCKPGAGLMEIEAIGDAYLRGGAGDALHALNLLFALHEKVGLDLKPSIFRNRTHGPSGQTSWFA